MRSCRKLALAALTGLLALSIGAGTASASRGIELTPKGANRASGTLTFGSPESEGIRIRCRLVLTLANVGEGGTAKELTTVLANVTGASFSECEGATVTVLAPEAANPWRVTYVSFLGTLPNITSVRLELRGYAFLLRSLTACLYGGNLQVTTVGTPIRELRVDEAVTVPLVRALTFGCTAETNYRGSLRFERSVTATLI